MRSVTTDEPGPPGDDLTPVRRKIVRVIEESMRSRGYSPSMREIRDAVGLASTSSVSHQLSVLQAKGYLAREPGRPRTMILRHPGQSDVSIGPREAPEGVTGVPLVGRIAAGVPILADELAEEVVPLPRMLVGNGDDLIMLKVVGDSMIGAAIADRDWLVVHRQGQRKICYHAGIVSGQRYNDKGEVLYNPPGPNPPARHQGRRHDTLRPA